MNSNDILIISFICCWALITFLFGILAFIKKPKYQKLKQLNDELKNNLKDINNFKLKEIKIDFDLPKGQKCFYKLDNCLVKFFIQKGLIQDDYLIKEKNFFKKNKFISLKTNIYLTNLFIVFETEQEFIKIKINELNYFYFNYQYKNKKWNLYLNLFFQKNKFLLQTEDINFYFTIKKIMGE